jgi:chromosomal replication initiator protein
MRAWDAFMDLQKRQLGEDVLKKSLFSLRLINFDAGNLYLEVATPFEQTWFDQHLRTKASHFLAEAANRTVKIHLRVTSTPQKKREWTPKLDLSPDALDPYATFASYLPGPDNDESLALLLKALETPGGFNPLYLHGPHQSGKSHLAMAAAHLCAAKGLKPFFVRSERFTKHVVTAIRLGEMQKFRQLYRSCDVLLLEDVDLLDGRSATQEEFFHTFNTLHGAGKQIILTATVPPSLLPAGIEPRLTSRFGWGLVLPFHPLSPDHLPQLLDLRLTALGATLSPAMREFLLHRAKTPSALVSALDSLLLHAHLHRLDPTTLSPTAAPHLWEKLFPQRITLRPEDIIDAVCETWEIPASSLLGKSQKKEDSVPRQIAIYLCRTRLQMPLKKIGKFFDRDHSTVITSVRTVQKKIELKDKELSDKLHRLEKLLEATIQQ